jgi:hypothetical protein
MKANKVLPILSAILLVSLLIAPQQIAQAKDSESAWIIKGGTGSEITVDFSANPGPEWDQVFSEGLKLDGPATICYPFRQASFHWVPEIRSLVNGKWSLLETSKEQLTSEGQYFACAKAPAAGTYALFGYYNGPVESQASKPSCGEIQTAGLAYSPSHLYSVSIGGEKLVPGTEVSWKVISTNPKNVLLGATTSGKATVNVQNEVTLPIDADTSISTYSITFQVDAGTCIYRETFNIAPMDL